MTRHAGPATATVRIAYGVDDLTIQVDDDGKGSAPNGTGGSGIRGMRERVAALGGELHTGPAPAAASGSRPASPSTKGSKDDPAGGVRGTPRGCPDQVLLADDQALVRAGFRALLDAQEGIEVVGEAADGEEAIRLARALRPDVVLMDIRMPGLDGLEATRAIAADELLAGVRIVILTTFDLDEYVFEALRVGASGFLVKNTEPADLIRGVRAVASGDALLSPGVTRRLVAEFATRARGRGRPPHWTS